MKKNVAIIGFGGMGEWHGNKILENNVVNLIGIWDIDEKRREYAKEKGIRVYSSQEEVLSDPDVDIVTIATPNDCHRPIAEAALAAGKNVISEKPVTDTSENLQAMIDASNKYGKLFTVHQNRRWDADFLRMKEIYKSGKLGLVHAIESRVQGSHGIPGDWRGMKEHGGGMVLDWGVHLIDQALQMVDEKIVSIYATMDHITNEEVDDGFKLDITFESGLVYRIEVGTSNFISLPRWYMVGNNGSAIINGFNKEGKIVCCEIKKDVNVVPVKTAAGLTKTMAPRSPETIKEFPLPEVETDVHDFYRNVAKAVDGIEPQLITHAQVMRVMKVMEAAFESDRLKQVVPFNE